MSGEPVRQVREQRPCEVPVDAKADGNVCDPRPGFRCDGCAEDGTRWIVVGTLRQARNHKYPQEGAYIAGTFCGFIDDETDLYGRCADGFYRPLYVVEEQS